MLVLMALIKYKTSEIFLFAYNVFVWLELLFPNFKTDFSNWSDILQTNLISLIIANLPLNVVL